MAVASFRRRVRRDVVWGDCHAIHRIRPTRVYNARVGWDDSTSWVHWICRTGKCRPTVCIGKCRIGNWRTRLHWVEIKDKRTKTSWRKMRSKEFSKRPHCNRTPTFASSGFNLHVLSSVVPKTALVLRRMQVRWTGEKYTCLEVRRNGPAYVSLRYIRIRLFVHKTSRKCTWIK